MLENPGLLPKTNMFFYLFSAYDLCHYTIYHTPTAILQEFLWGVYVV